MTATQERGNRKFREGVVVSDQSDKTIIVGVERRVRHPLYGKQIRRMKKYHVHDEDNRARRGNVVRISECRPLSKTKHWRLVDIIREHE